MCAIVLALAAMIGGPAQHRLVGRGNVSTRLLRVVGHLAAAALLFLGMVLACDAYIISERYVGAIVASILATGAFLAAMALWFALGWWLKPVDSDPPPKSTTEEISLREKIEQMLNEAWVVLPGATGILGFQLLVTSLSAFEAIDWPVRVTHFIALGFIGLALLLLLTPAALHRKAFSGREDARSLRIGSRIVGLALAPLSVGLTLDFYVAVGRMVGYHWPTALAAACVSLLLWGTWYVAPWMARSRCEHPGPE